MTKQDASFAVVGDTRLICASTVEEINGLRPAWERLQRHPNTDVDFFLTIIGSRSNIKRPHVILIVAQGHPRALVVGRIEYEPLLIPIGYRVIRAPHIRRLMVPYGGFLGEWAPEDERLVMRHFLEMLDKREIDSVCFDHLDTGSSMYALATTLPTRICRWSSSRANPHHRLSLTRTYEDYLHGLSRITRKNLKRYSRRLIEEWGDQMAVRCYTSPQDLEALLRDAESVARKTYQRGLGVGFELNAEHRKRIRLELERGWLHAWFLYLGQRPVAFSLVCCYRDVAYASETGYDPDFGKYRVGHFLNEWIIRELSAAPSINALDYGFGDAEYKRSICDHVWNEASVHIFSNTLRGVGLHALQAAFGKLERVARLFLDRIGLLQMIKRLWRRSVVPCMVYCYRHIEALGPGIE